jgi:O-antigen/teichoic acid export membrane protein
VALAVGTLVGGVLAYLFFALVTRGLGADAAAPVSVLWTYWTVAAAVLTFPLQHWTIRTLAADGHEGTVARSRGRIWGGAVGLSVFSGVVAYVGRDVLFRSDAVAFPAMIAGLTAGACLSGLVRGGLAGRGLYVATGMAVAAENVVRVVLAGIVTILGGGAVAFGAVLTVGSLSGLLWRASLRFEASEAVGAPLGSPLALASGLAVGSLISQIVLTGGPVVLAAIGGSPDDVTSLFIALAVWRAPYMVALGVAPQLTPRLTQLAMGGDAGRLRWIRRWSALAVVAGSVVAATIGATLAGPLIRLVFGPDVGLDAVALALIGVGTAVGLGNLLLLLILLAHGRSRFVTAAWVGGLGTAVLWIALLPGAPLSRVVGAFVAAQGVAFVLQVTAGAAALRQSAPAADVTAAAEAASAQAPPGTL